VKGQYALGYMYAHGWGVPQDYSEAMHWYRKAADQEYAPAEYALAFSYSQGHGMLSFCTQATQALRWCRKAADQGYPIAQHDLGLRYSRGEGVRQDYAEAARWYRNAADQGYAMAQKDLGLLFANGQGVARDYVRGYMWISLAASSASGDLRRECISVRDFVGRKMTAEQIAGAARLARGWKPSGAASEFIGQW
jgi:TPR repeat protein